MLELELAKIVSFIDGICGEEMDYGEGGDDFFVSFL
jgi:hypothetical protein